VWLTLKTIARSPRWTEEAAIKGRGLSNVFLIGNGLSIFYAIAGYGVALWIAGPSWLRDTSLATTAAISLAVASTACCVWLLMLRNSKYDRLRTMPELTDEGYREVTGRSSREK
jgi:hypothetical protein